MSNSSFIQQIFSNSLIASCRLIGLRGGLNFFCITHSNFIPLLNKSALLFIMRRVTLSSADMISLYSLESLVISRGGADDTILRVVLSNNPFHFGVAIIRLISAHHARYSVVFPEKFGKRRVLSSMTTTVVPTGVADAGAGGVWGGGTVFDTVGVVGIAVGVLGADGVDVGMVDDVEPSDDANVVFELSADLMFVSSEDIFELILFSIAEKVDDTCDMCCLNIAAMVSDNFVNFLLE